MTEIFDFGFTTVNHDELDVYKESVATVEQADKKSVEMFDAISLLLTNLKANPEKEYILWPDRVAKIEAFEQHLKGIMDS